MPFIVSADYHSWCLVFSCVLAFCICVQNLMFYEFCHNSLSTGLEVDSPMNEMQSSLNLVFILGSENMTPKLARKMSCGSLNRDPYHPLAQNHICFFIFEKWSPDPPTPNPSNPPTTTRELFYWAFQHSCSTLNCFVLMLRFSVCFCFRILHPSLLPRPSITFWANYLCIFKCFLL